MGFLLPTDAEGITVRNAYDQNGNLAAVTDGKGNTTRFEYDGIKRLLRTTHPDGATESFTYNQVNKTSRTDAEGKTTTYAYVLAAELNLYAVSKLKRMRFGAVFHIVGVLFFLPCRNF